MRRKGMAIHPRWRRSSMEPAANGIIPTRLLNPSMHFGVSGKEEKMEVADDERADGNNGREIKNK